MQLRRQPLHDGEDGLIRGFDTLWVDRCQNHVLAKRYGSPAAAAAAAAVKIAGLRSEGKELDTARLQFFEIALHE